MTFSQNFYLFKGSWEISLLFLIVLVVLPYGGLLQQHLQGVRSIKFCWAAYSGQGSNITAIGKGFIMSTVGVEFPNIGCTILTWYIIVEAFEETLGYSLTVLGCKVSGNIFGLFCLQRKEAWVLIFSTGYVGLLYSYFESWYTNLSSVLV